jgi:hypothetical protein
MILPARRLPHFRGLAGTYSYKNKPLSLKKAACLPPKRLSQAMAGSHCFAEKRGLWHKSQLPSCLSDIIHSYEFRPFENVQIR